MGIAGWLLIGGLGGGVIGAGMAAALIRASRNGRQQQKREAELRDWDWEDGWESAEREDGVGWEYGAEQKVLKNTEEFLIRVRFMWKGIDPKGLLIGVGGWLKRHYGTGGIVRIEVLRRKR